MRAEEDLVARQPVNLDDGLGVLRIDAGRKRKRRRSRRVLVAVLGLSVAAAAVGSRFWTRPAEVEVARATRIDPAAPTTVLTAGGYIIANRKIELSPKITGRIEWVGVDRGDHVRKGQELIRLEQRDLLAQRAQARANVRASQAHLQELLAGSREEDIEQARASVDEAESNLVLADLSVKRTQKLYNDGLVARQLLDDGRNQYEIARAKLKAAQERLRLVMAGPRPEEIDRARGELEQAQASLELAEANLDNTIIRAPIDGTILERLAEPGETVTTTIVSQMGAKSAMLSMADLRNLQAEVDVNQNDLKKLQLKMPAVVIPDANPDRVYEGFLAEMAPEANRQKATLRVRIQIRKPDQFIRPEMNARVVFQEPPKTPHGPVRVTVPKDAVVSRGDARVVYVIADGKAVERRVSVGAMSSSQIDVLAGLEGGETIAVGGAAALKDGEVVRVK